jgi:hypothetical protein
MFGRRLINTQQGGGCTTDTLQILGDTSCVATYRLNGNATDLSGNYNGTATSVTYVAGQFEDAGSFNGTSSKISTSVIPLTNTSFSVSLWFNVNSFQIGTLFAQGNSSSSSPIISVGLISSTGFELVNRNNSQVGLVKSVTISPAISTATWYHLVWSCTATESKLYLENALVDTNTFTSNTGTFNTQNIGVRQRLGYYGYFDGSIDQVRISIRQ